MGWTVRGSNPGGIEIFRTRPDSPWGPPSLPYPEYRVFNGSKVAGSRRWPPTLSSDEVKESVQLYIHSPLWAFVVCWALITKFVVNHPFNVQWYGYVSYVCTLLAVHKSLSTFPLRMLLCRKRGVALGWGTALQAGRLRVRFPMVSLQFVVDLILLAAMCPWRRLSL